MNIRVAFVVLGWAGVTAFAQPALSVRFDNGLSEITVAPGSQVNVRVWATGLPPVGTPTPWTTPPGTGQVGQYAGFLSVLFNMQASGGTWSVGIPAPGHGFAQVDFHPSGSSINGINIGVGFNPPVPEPEFDLFYATLTVGNADIQLNTALQPTGAPPQVGLEAALSGLWPGPPPLNVSQYLAALNGSAVIHVPSPAGAVVLLLGGAAAWRRRRVMR